MSETSEFERRLADLDKHHEAGRISDGVHLLKREDILLEWREELARKGRLGPLALRATGLPAPARIKGRTGLQYKRAALGDALETKTAGVRIRGKGDDPDTFRMYGLTFGGPADRQGDVILPRAVANTEEFCRDGWIAWSHMNASLPIAIPLSADQDDRGFLVKAEWHDTAEARECRAVVRQRQAAGKRVLASVGYTVNDSAPGRVDGQPVRLLKSINVYECSICLLPANNRAEVLG
jgi:HK97 family phage prohead protease